MSDFMLLTGDIVNFDPAFGAAVVAVVPGNLNGTVNASLDGKKVCVDGDEKNVMVPGCSYVQGSFVGGVGTLKIKALGGDQKAQKTQIGNKAVLLKGSVFTAEFQVTAPAVDSASGTPDPMPMYTGTGSFITTNMKWKAE